MIIKKDDLVVMKIEGMNHEGQGVGKIEGFTVFVNGAMLEEIVQVQIKIIKKNYAVGDICEIVKASVERALPFCPVYEKCGGCDLQHMSYRESLNFKTNVITDALKRIGKVGEANIHKTIGMEQPFKYRNKVQFPYAMERGRAISGLYARKSHNIVSFLECPIQMEVNDKIRRIVDEFVTEYGVSIYDEATGKGIFRHLMVRTASKSDEVMVVMVLNGKSFEGIEYLVKNLVSFVTEIKSIYINVNKKATNVILGEKNTLIYGNENIIDCLGGYKFGISPVSFFQVNPIQTEVLYEKVLEYAALTGEETVFDLYCGVGSISLSLSKKAKKVYGVEVIKEAIEDARKNAKLNGVQNIEFVVGKAESIIPEMYKTGTKADVVVVDPPRKGCETDLLDTIIQMSPKRVVYVSCNPSTLARDLRYLVAGGYEVCEVQGVDMFPWTRHVECVVWLEKNTSL